MYPPAPPFHGSVTTGDDDTMERNDYKEIKVSSVSSLVPCELKMK